jgi:cobalt-precorrin 5A hydrolase/precorrin-3B C17-methyltransferase
VDEGRRFAIALLGGHYGANDLAQRVAAAIGAEPVISNARDAEGIRALPPLPGKRIVVGVGASRGVSAEEVLETVDAAVAEAGLSPASVVTLATADLKADEHGILEAARLRRWPLVCHPASELAEVEVPNPSEIVRAAAGTPSVAEAAALYRGPGRAPGRLLVHKKKSAREYPMATAAVAEQADHERGRLAVIGLGPGARDLTAPRALAELRDAEIVVGLDQYVDQVRDVLAPGVRIEATGLGAEEQRARSAVDLARAGHRVALIGSGDAGV